MKVIICPDSFKGTLTAKEAADIIERGVMAACPDAECIKIPVADGGEGSLEAFGARLEYVSISNPFFEKTDAPVGFLNGNSAVIEMATAAGLPLVKERANPRLTTTYGVGEEILFALEAGVRELIICLGGSATNDAGCGMAAALGARFFDSDGNEFVPVGETLSKIESIDLSGMDSRLSKCKITAMCDVKNPLYGENGAAYVYAPQKGASPEDVILLDAGLRHFSEKCLECLGRDVKSIPGSGAAGGMGAGVVAFLGGKLRSGIETVLEVKKFDKAIIGADAVITGEGRFDSQSLSGKAVTGIASHMKDSAAKLFVVAGSVDASLRSLGRIDAVFSIQQTPLSFEEAIKHTEENLLFTVKNLVRAVSRQNLGPFRP